MGRQMIGVAGLGAAAIFLTATILTTNDTLVLIFLSLVFGGVTFQQHNLGAVCLDVDRRHAGGHYGVCQFRRECRGGVSSVEFGYLVGHFGSYNAPLIPMVLALRGNALVANRGSDKRAIRQRARRRSSVFEIANLLPLRSRMVGNWAVGRNDVSELCCNPRTRDQTCDR